TGRRSFCYTVFYQYVVLNGTKIGIILQSLMPPKFRNNQKNLTFDQYFILSGIKQQQVSLLQNEFYTPRTLKFGRRMV
ncbi:MAG: hypothetical protein LBG58_07720, partial [Planctomycetaceae bacterium]|nr:hypothetical protein [Planctomycetaceae bacterium]